MIWPAPEHESQGQTGVVHLLEPLKKGLRYQGVKNVHTLGGDEYLPSLGDKGHPRAKVMPTHFRILSPPKPAVSDTCRRVYAHSYCLAVLASYKQETSGAFGQWRGGGGAYPRFTIQP